MREISRKIERTLACVGSYAYDAEMQIETDDHQTKVLHVNYFDGFHFTVAERSIIDYVTGETTIDPDVTFEKSYDNLDETRDSDYYTSFLVLYQAIMDYGDQDSADLSEVQIEYEKPYVSDWFMGMRTANAEMKIIDNGKIRFLLVYWADANGYQVTDTSWDDHCNDDNFNWDTAKFYENYESLDDASSSRYFEFFCKLESLISDAVDNS